MPHHLSDVTNLDLVMLRQGRKDLMVVRYDSEMIRQADCESRGTLLQHFKHGTEGY